MKSLKFLIVISMFMFAAFLFAQATHTIDFEAAGVGADWDWTVAENADNPALEFIDNPVSGGINTSAKVAKFTARQAGNPWALTLTDDDGEFTFDATNSTVKIMVYKPVISNVGVKFEGTSPAVEIQIANTVTNQWEELTFDFSGSIGNIYSRIIIIPDFTSRTQENIIYFDNIQVPDGELSGPLPEPTTAPDAPTHDSDDVISIYSETYTNLSGTDFNPPWGQSTSVSVDYNVAGNNTIKYGGLNYQGTQYTNQNVSGYEYLHVDYWTPNATTLDFYLISPGQETFYSLPITTETWMSADIPLTDYVPPVDLTNVFQFKVVGNNTVYFDNWYFWKNPAGASNDATLNDLQVDGETVDGFNSVVYTYDVELPAGTTVVPTVTATTNNPFASKDITDAASLPGITEVEVTAVDGVTTQSYYLNFTVASAVNAPEDNAANPPAREPENVISIYSDYYTDITGINYNPFWGQSGTVDTAYDIGTGNYIMEYANFNYQGTDFAGNPQNASNMEYLHVDIWTADATNIRVSPINNGTGVGEFLVPITFTQGEWSSVDLPIGDFTGMTWDSVFQMKFDAQAGVTPVDIYLDNIYFWKNPTASGTDATLSDLQVDGTTITDFSPLTENYVYGLLEGTVSIPQITTATPTDPNVESVVINQASTIPGDATIIVTAEDATTTITYTVSFAITTPNSLPPIPPQDQNDVISLFSDSYDDVSVDTWLTGWSQGTLEDVTVAGNSVKKYSSLNFAGIETTGANLINASVMSHFHIDVWTPDINDFKIKLVDFGADGVWSPTVDDTEHELIYSNPETATWISYDIPLTDFTNLNNTGNMAQYILSKPTEGTIYIDNMYFYNQESLNVPTNVVIATTSSEVTITWDAVDGATSYKIYSCDSPDGTFTIDTSGTFVGASWTAPLSGVRKFYYIEASNE